MTSSCGNWRSLGGRVYVAVAFGLPRRTLSCPRQPQQLVVCVHVWRCVRDEVYDGAPRLVTVTRSPD